MDQSQFRIKWDSYLNNVSKGLSSLQQNAEFVDMTLAADGHLVQVHKNVVALASPYLKAMLQSASCQHPVIFLNNISHEVLSYILEYIYMGEVNVPPNVIHCFIEVCKSLCISGVDAMAAPKDIVSNSTTECLESAEDNTSKPSAETPVELPIESIEILPDHDYAAQVTIKAELDNNELNVLPKNNTHCSKNVNTSSLNPTATEMVCESIKVTDPQHKKQRNIDDIDQYLVLKCKNSQNSADLYTDKTQNTFQICSDVKMNYNDSNNINNAEMLPLIPKITVTNNIGKKEILIETNQICGFPQTSQKDIDINTIDNFILKDDDNVWPVEFNDNKLNNNSFNMSYDIDITNKIDLVSLNACESNRTNTRNVNVVNDTIDYSKCQNEIIINNIDTLNNSWPTDLDTSTLLDSVNVNYDNKTHSFDNIEVLPLDQSTNNVCNTGNVDIDSKTNETFDTSMPKTDIEGIDEFVIMKPKNTSCTTNSKNVINICSDITINPNSWNPNSNHQIPNMQSSNILQNLVNIPLNANLTKNIEEHSTNNINSQQDHSQSVSNALPNSTLEMPLLGQDLPNIPMDISSNIDLSATPIGSSINITLSKDGWQLSSDGNKSDIKKLDSKTNTNNETIKSDKKKKSSKTQIPKKLRNATKAALSKVARFEMDKTVHYTISNRGSLQMILNRFLYHAHHNSSGGRKYRWRCINYRRGHCPAYIDTDNDEIVKISAEHAHPDHNREIIKKIHANIIFTTFTNAIEGIESLKNSQDKK